MPTKPTAERPTRLYNGLGHPYEPYKVHGNGCTLGHPNPPRGEEGYTLSGDPKPEEGSEDYERIQAFVNKYKH